MMEWTVTSGALLRYLSGTQFPVPNTRNGNLVPLR